MAAPQNFRTAFNGFNREDVVHYLEYLNNKHVSQVNQLEAEVEELRAQLEQQPASSDQELTASLQEECASLTRQLQEALERCAQLEQQLEEKDVAAPEVQPEPEEKPVLSPTAAQELEAYRRAERIERVANERAELVYHQTNAVLAKATDKVDNISCQVAGVADRVMEQVSQLQQLVYDSKQALLDASSIMNAIRPKD